MNRQENIYDMTDRKLRAYRRKLRRQRELRRRIMTAVMTLCMIVICAVSYHSLKTSANTGEDTISFKYYTNVTVQSGETVWDIADDYIDYNQYKDKNAYITEVVHINNLDENASIRSGQLLTVPYYSEEFIK